MAIDLVNEIEAELTRHFDGLIMTMSSNAISTIHPTIYQAHVKYFQMVILIYEDCEDERNQVEYEFFRPCLENIVSQYSEFDSVLIVPILINNPRSYPLILDNIVCLELNNSTAENEREEFFMRIQDTFHHHFSQIEPYYLRDSSSRASFDSSSCHNAIHNVNIGRNENVNDTVPLLDSRIGN